jgi:glycosyltransferase involved in cell wall biosynthesis
VTTTALVFYPFPNLREEGWGNSLRATLLIRYLAERADRVETLSTAAGGQVTETRGPVRHRQLAAPAVRRAAERWRLRLTRLTAGLEAAYAQNVLARFDEPRHLAQFDAAVSDMLTDADVAFVEYPFWVPRLAPACRRAGVPLVLSLYDIHALAHQARPRTAARIAARELEAIRLADAVFCASGDDRAYLARHGIDAALAINPIDVAGCRPASADAARALRTRYALGDGPICMFVGSRIVPNIEAAAALERLAPEMPDCAFAIAGRCVRAGRSGNVVRLGWLPSEELAALYAAADVVAMPLSSGTGTSLKFVEAMAYGKAIVATHVAARGYEARSGVHAHLVADVGDMPAALRRVIGDPAYGGSLAAGARTLATRYDFRTVFEPYGAWLRRGRVHSAPGAKE